MKYLRAIAELVGVTIAAILVPVGVYALLYGAQAVVGWALRTPVGW